MIKVSIKDIELILETSDKVFSPRSVDEGTLAMLSVVDFHENDKVLDLGCGYGIVGILAAKFCKAHHVVMTDIHSDAVRLSRNNAELNGVSEVRIYLSDGFKEIQDKDFTIILSNPPYHVDFNTPKQFIEKGFNRLQIGGKMYMVTKRKEWYKRKLISIFGGVRLWEINGYYVFMAEKKDMNYARKNSYERQK